jgi:hypothetical protein
LILAFFLGGSNGLKGFSQAYNAQAWVEPKSMLIIEAHVTQNPNDKNEMIPGLDNLANLPKSLGKVEKAGADADFFPQQNVQACEDRGIDPYICPGRVNHHPTLKERLAPLVTTEPPSDSSPTDKMRHKLTTETGKAVYKLRKQVVEPVFGVVKSVMGFGRFSQRGINKTDPEWKFVCMCYNYKKMHKLNLILV